MAETENSVARSIEAPAAESVTLSQLQQQVESLRSLLNGALMALLLLSAGVTIYLYRQDNLLTKELANARAVVRDYEDVKQPLLNAFVARLHEYAQAHTNFNPILEKYGVRPGAQPGQTNPAAVQPKPAP